MDRIGDGKLLLVTVSSPGPSTLQAVETALLRYVREADIRRLQDSVFAIYTEAEPAQVRDWLSIELREEDSALVVEFEHWSSYGKDIDRSWLLRRGH